MSNWVVLHPNSCVNILGVQCSENCLRALGILSLDHNGCSLYRVLPFSFRKGWGDEEKGQSQPGSTHSGPSLKLLSSNSISRRNGTIHSSHKIFLSSWYVADSVGSWKEIPLAFKGFISYNEWTLAFEKLSQCNVTRRGDTAKQLPPPTTYNQNNNTHITCILCLSLSTIVLAKSYLILDFSYRKYLK